MKKTFIILMTMMFFANASAQKSLKVVPEVDLKRYSGTWYEIARKPFSFESKLKCITATYTLRDDGKITVLNSGQYISDPSRSTSSKGTAVIPDKNVPAKLKVWFFWPFKGNYWILELDDDYKYVLIGEPSLKYLWVLARDKKLEQPVLDRLFKTAVDSGYDISDIIMTEQDCN